LIKTIKTIGIATMFLVPAITVAVGLIYILAAVDYGPDPRLEVGTTIWGIWALQCGYYFKSRRFKQAGFLLIVFAVISLYVNHESFPDETNNLQETNSNIAQESRPSIVDSSSTLDLLTRTADDINSRLPMMVDSNTRLDSTIGLTNRFQYNYTIMSLSSAEIDEASLLQQIETQIVNRTCTLEDNLSFLKIGVTIDYVYRANDGVRITTISVSPEDCGF
jgi:hypothetical protein